MRIPSGDLSPARHRRRGGGYSRRRGRSTPVLAVLLIAALAGGAAYAFLRDDTPKADGLASTACATPTASAAPTKAAVVPVTALPNPRQVRLALFNGTPRANLAKSVGNQLAARGFTVTQATNAPAALAGPATVSYGRAALPAATLVSRNLLGSKLVSKPAAHPASVEVVLGASFRRLSTPNEMIAAARVKPPKQIAATPAPKPNGCR